MAEIFWNKESTHICMFQFKQSNLSINSAGISCQAAIRADDAVTWDDNGYFVVPNGSAYGLGRHAGDVFCFGYLLGNLAVSDGFSIGDL